jgi:hypothetical protein
MNRARPSRRDHLPCQVRPLDEIDGETIRWPGAAAPTDYVVQALPAAVAGLAGLGVRACVEPSWSEPLVLWQGLVGASSTGKTPALDAIGRPLGAVEKLLSRDAGAGVASGEQGKGAVVVHDARQSDRVRLSCVHDLLENGIALAGIAEIRPAARAQRAPCPATSRAPLPAKTKRSEPQCRSGLPPLRHRAPARSTVGNAAAAVDPTDHQSDGTSGGTTSSLLGR